MGKHVDRRSGEVQTWFAAKGYGFIAPDGGGPDVFVHQSAIQTQGSRSLTSGDRLEFSIVKDAEGRTKATHVDILQCAGTLEESHFLCPQGENCGRKARSQRGIGANCSCGLTNPMKPSCKALSGAWAHETSRAHRRHDKKGEAKRTKEDIQGGRSLSNWATIPMDVMWTAAHYVRNLADLGRMRLVCRHWRYAVSLSIRELSYPVPAAEIAEEFPLLFYLDLSGRQPWNHDGSQEALLSGVQSLSRLRRLQKLNFSGWPELQDQWLKALTRLTNLRDLDLSQCPEITDSGWQSLSEMTALKVLNLKGCWRLQSLRCAPLVNLLELNLQGCTNINDSSLAALTMLVHLSFLNLSSCASITGRGLRSLSSLKRLSSLRLNDLGELGDTDVEGLVSVTSLIFLQMGEWDLSDSGILALAGLPRLADLDLIGAGIMGIALSSLTTLTRLRCENCYQLDDNAPFFIGQLTSLQALSLPSCTEIGPEGVTNLVALQNLTDLNLSDLPDLDDECLEQMSVLRNLTSLDLSGTHWGGFCDFTDNGALALQAFTKLNTLRISRWAGLSDIGLSALQILTRLKDMDLSWCKGVTTDGIAYLKPLTELTSLDISWCLGLNGQRVAALLPNVKLRT
ncbi:unnamed protein product [Ostreobium quekettii]|uniref:CSD domain-containing protein n=1 Tax=Ostreobium quekettii TaxID=121088 RepID=A0A8S1J6E6_9CHLO|nr:unnamed protein product [Ostreobium quekettii]|eukprot:evm.model.scf_1565.2 EVM.evm.TU.scf_1565.2   scf_1565:3642-8078(-)